MSQQTISDPAKIDETKLDGYKKIGAIILGAVGTLVMFAVKDPAQQAAANQVIAMVQNLIPVGAAVIYAAIQGIVDVVKVNTAGKVAEAQVQVIAQTPAASTPMFDNPEYSKSQPAQITAFNQPIAVMQNKLITPNPTSVMLNAATEMVSTPKGSVDYLMGELGETIDREYQHMLDVNPNLGTLERVQEVVKKYLGINLTPDDCKAVQAMIGLPEILHSYADKTILAGLWAAYQAKQLGPAVMPGLMKRAYQMAREDVIIHAEAKVQKAETDAEIKAALADIGLGEYAQKTYIPTGKQFYVNFNGGLKPLSVAAFFNLDPVSMEPI
jgi:hypothetical protein